MITIISFLFAFFLFCFYLRSDLGLITLAVLISLGILYSRFLISRPQVDISSPWLKEKALQLFPFLVLILLGILIVVLFHKFFPNKTLFLREKVLKFQAFYWENSFEALHRFFWRSSHLYDRLVRFLESSFPSSSGIYQNVVLGLLIIFPFGFLNVLFIVELWFFHHLFWTFQFLWILLLPQLFRIWLAIKNDIQLRGGLTFLLGLEKCFEKGAFTDEAGYGFAFVYKEERILEVLDHAMKTYPECFTFWESPLDYLEDYRSFLLNSADVLNLQLTLLPRCRKIVFFGSLINIIFQFLLFYIFSEYFF